MKIRHGFVSNSSTSSFLIVGWEVELTEEQQHIVDSMCNYREVYDRREEGDPRWGLRIASGYDDDDFEVSIKDAQAIIKKAQTIAEGAKLPEPVIMGGSYYH